jgi:hypothetical protein
MEPGSCSTVLRVLQSLIERGQSEEIPLVLLRPREVDAATMFDGDFDFLIDETRFAEILQAVFSTCQAAGVSFVLQQQSAFKRQIDLLDVSGRSVTLEFWPHAEFRTSGGHGHLTRAAIGYGAYRALDKDRRGSLLAAIFLLHLHHKKKDLGLGLVRQRLAYFRDQPAMAPELRVMLQALESRTADLAAAQQCALAYLHAQGIPFLRPWRLLAQRLRWTAGNLLKWPALHTSAVVGPDGSGKTSLLNDVKKGPLKDQFRFQRFKRFIRRPFFHLKRSEPRNVRDEKMLWLILPGAWAYFSLSRWFTGWGKPLMLDRYFYDYFVRNVRSHTEPFRRILTYDLCTRLAPRPERLIVASCPVPTIHARKQEMAEASIGQMYAMYLDQVVRGGVPATLFCYTGAGLEQSLNDVSAFLRNPELA